MTQRQISHAPGQIPRCPAPCHRDQKHIHDKRGMHVGGGHFIECCACDRRTSKSQNFDAALHEWCRITNRKAPGTQADLLNQPLRTVRAIRQENTMQNQFVKLDSTAAILSSEATTHDLVLQPAANLMFAALPLKKENGKTNFTFAEAEQACKALRTGGFDDWRLPTVKELFGIVDHEKYNPAIDSDAFPNTESNWHWTSTPVASDPEDVAWIVAFPYGLVFILSRSGAAGVRAVRSVSPPSQ